MVKKKKLKTLNNLCLSFTALSLLGVSGSSCFGNTSLQVAAQPVNASVLVEGYKDSLGTVRVTPETNYYKGWIITRERNNGVYVLRDMYTVGSGEAVDSIGAFVTLTDPENLTVSLWCLTTLTDLHSINPIWRGYVDYVQYSPLVMSIDGDYPAGFYTGDRYLPTSQSNAMVIPFAYGTQSITIKGIYATNNDYIREQGYQDGYNAGSADGYESGYTDGYNNGYDKGSEEGIEDTGFIALFNAILSAPVTMIGGALDFELFGINIKSLVFVLLTVAIVVFVIGIFKGKKE